MDKNMTMLGRRSFLAGMGIAGIGTLAACAPKASDNPSVDELADTGAETVSAASGPKEVTAETVRIIPTGEQMSLEELNEKRQALIDSKTEDYTMADGTVVPNVYVKLRALFDGYGNGLGSVLHDAAFGEVMHLFTPEDAQAPPTSTQRSQGAPQKNAPLCARISPPEDCFSAPAPMARRNITSWQRPTAFGNTT